MKTICIIINWEFGNSRSIIGQTCCGAHVEIKTTTIHFKFFIGREKKEGRMCGPLAGIEPAPTIVHGTLHGYHELDDIAEHLI